jgi:hypothetical protein
MSVCDYTGSIEVGSYTVTKDPFDNVFLLELQLKPELVLYKSLDWRNGLYFGGNTKIELM